MYLHFSVFTVMKKKKTLLPQDRRIVISVRGKTVLSLLKFTVKRNESGAPTLFLRCSIFCDVLSSFSFSKFLFIHEMLLSLNHISYACPSPRTHSSSLICPIPKTLIFEYHNSSSSSSNNPSLKFLVRSSSADNPQTLPHSAIQRIADKLRSLGFTEETETKAPTTAGEIFIPLPNRLPKYRVGQTLDPSWSTPENPVPVPGSGKAISRYHELRREVKREREAKKGEAKVPSLAELSLPNEELRRLRTIGIAEKRKLKVGKAGITEGIVNGIHERWRRSEVVKIVCEDLCRMNMKRTHDLLEVG